METGTIEAGGKQAELTKNELRIMYYLFEHDGVICTRADLIEYLWDHLDKILKKIEREYKVFAVEDGEVTERKEMAE